jgi:hypothetical protein
MGYPIASSGIPHYDLDWIATPIRACNDSVGGDDSDWIGHATMWLAMTKSVEGLPCQEKKLLLMAVGVI